MKRTLFLLTGALALFLPAGTHATGSIFWGSAVNGLELGISAGPDTKIASIAMQVFVKNVTTSSMAIDTQKTLASVLQNVVLRQNGHPVQYSTQYYGTHVKDITIPANNAIRLIGAFYVSSTTSFRLPSGQYSISDNGTVYLANGT